MQQSSDTGKNRFGQIQMLTECICEMSDRDKRWVGWGRDGGGRKINEFSPISPTKRAPHRLKTC